MEKYGLLKKLFGHDSFRDGQGELIDSVMSGRDVLGIMPTGAGKSICYQIPAVMLEGMTLVISPLISLMKDQVGGAVQSGVRAAYLNSSLDPRQQDEVLYRARHGEYKLLYVAPERLLTPDFLAFTSAVKISLIAVDEAHCVSQWGQDFRPHYLDIAKFCGQLAERPVMSAFTATATGEVRADIKNLLGLRDPFVTVTGFDRPNLFFDVQRPESGKFEALQKVLERNAGRSGIIYCSTRKTVEQLCEKLTETGCSATRYHAGLDATERRINQEDFIYDRKCVMVATNAFGMGIDKSNVSFVVHYNMPKSLEAYYQEAGRAGRDGEPSECVLLFSGQDVRTCLFLIDSNENPELDAQTAEKVKEKDKERLNKMINYCMCVKCLRGYILDYFGEKAAERCDNCGVCNSYYEQTDVTVEAQKIVSCVYRMNSADGLSFGRTLIAEVLHGGRSEKVLRYGFDRLSTWGIMSDTPVPRITAIIDRLIVMGYLKESDDRYRTVELSARYTEITREKKQILMPLPAAKRERQAKKSASTVSLSPVEKSLLDELRDVRSQIAAREHTPAFTIVTNASLQDMCKKLPGSKTEFLGVSGIGEYKADHYWQDFMPVLAKHIARLKEKA